MHSYLLVTPLLLYVYGGECMLLSVELSSVLVRLNRPHAQWLQYLIGLPPHTIVIGVLS